MTEEDKKEVKRVVKGLLEVAEIAMPDTYYATDSRVKAAKELLSRIKNA